MTNFTYELPSEDNPTRLLEGLSPEAQAALSHAAMGPSSADKLLGKVASIGMKSERHMRIDETWQEVHAFAGQLYPDDAEKRKLFTKDFQVEWDEERGEPAIWHIDPETGKKDEDYHCVVLGEKVRGTLLLPRQLRATVLSCGATGITGIREFPDSLREIYCVRNKSLKALPDLPASLETLACTKGKLTSLPKLPDGLTELHCSGNPLETLPELPDSLRKLHCNNVLLSELPALPPGLTSLDCSHNALGVLPDLPVSLRELRCDETGLQSLPAVLPDLTHLTATTNAITELPELPDTLRICNISDNPLSRRATKAAGNVGMMKRRLG